MKKKMLNLLIPIFFIFSFQISAQTKYIDLAERIADSLRAHGMVQVTSVQTVIVKKKYKDAFPDKYRLELLQASRTTLPGSTAQRQLILVKGEILIDFPTSIQIKDSQFLTAKNIRITNVDSLNWGADSTENLPEKILSTDAICDNSKGQQPLSCAGTLSLVFQRTSTLTFTQSVEHSQAMTISASGGPPVFKVGISATFGEKESSGTATSDANSSTLQIQKTYSVTVAPKSSALTRMKVWTVRHTMAFTSYVTIDADLSNNDLGIKTLSQIFPGSSRTFLISGILTADDCSTAVIQNLPAKIL